MAKPFLPPGFRFHPTDVELVWYYLKRKVIGKSMQFEAISEVELYKFSPWELPEKSCLHTKDLEWYFFCPRDRKYPNGIRTNRATDIGYWKATGRDRTVMHNSCIVGMKKTLIFHVGKPPKGNRTDWVMYEYRLESKELADAGYSQNSYVLCKVFQKSGSGPRIGEQYGAPFNEEDWEDSIDGHSFLLPCVNCLSPESLDNQCGLLDHISEQPAPFGEIGMPSDPDLSEFGGILLEELEQFPSACPLREDICGQILDSAIPINDINYSSEVDQDQLFNELEILTAEALIHGNIDNAENIPSEIMLHSTITELDTDQYVELNDLCFIWDSNPPEYVAPPS
ncbi:NAC domain-containing protein 53-like [Zingiber officinale]|uniref:NAC domain-containing protein 53-like n=1 Tax=Zingiber officinale TaxID=94328 RepID=UPI001C4B6DB4|nr:NAC domain-containing protein 53-like [Zingiber officinale]